MAQQPRPLRPQPVPHHLFYGAAGPYRGQHHPPIFNPVPAQVLRRVDEESEDDSEELPDVPYYYMPAWAQARVDRDLEN